MRIELPCRRSTPGSRQLTIGLLVAALATTLPLASARADDDGVVDAPPHVDVEFAELLDEPDEDEVITVWTADDRSVRSNLEQLWRRRIAAINQVCTLTDAQKQKLEFVVRGDTKRHLDRLREIDAQFRLGRMPPDEARVLADEAHEIQFKSSTVRSLTANFAAKLLTPEQFARYEPLRMVIQLGGRFQFDDADRGEVVEIDVHRTAFADDDAHDLRSFPHLQRFLLADTEIGDGGLAHVDGLQQLIWLDAAGTRVTDAGLQHLHNLSRLQWLSLARTGVTNAGLAQLRGLANLEALNLDGTMVTDEGMSHLAGLTRLRRIYLRNAHVTEAALDKLQRALPHVTIHVRGGQSQNQARMGMMGMGVF